MTYTNLGNRDLNKRAFEQSGEQSPQERRPSTVMFPVAALLPVLLASVPAAQAWGGPLLNLSYAQYEGIYNRNTDTNIWYGIRFAQAPVGDLRWQPPVEIEKNNNYSSLGAINATVFAPECVQGTPFWGAPGGNVTYPPAGQEDCLFLTIEAPAHPVSDALPILLQIHGGGFTEGNNQVFDAGGPFVQTSQGNLITVSIQYRLGVYGFLQSSDVLKNGSANVGLLDQRAGIEWAQRNAKSFGGDPNKITIQGSSAGGGSVTGQMIMYGGVDNPPFRAVIAECPWWQRYHDDKELEAQYSLLLETTGCGSLDCLRQVDEATLLNATQKVYVLGYQRGLYGYGDFYFGPSVDGNVIQDLPSNEFKQGHFTKVPLLSQRDGWEGVTFTNKTLNTTNSQTDELADLERLFPEAGPSFVNRLLEVYPPDDFNSTYYHRGQWFGDFVIECPSAWMAQAVADAGLPAYKMMVYAGTEQHGAELPFVYLNNNDGTPGANDTIGAYMKDWWISFIVNLNPNAQSFNTSISKPHWPSYWDGDGFNAMSVNYTQIAVIHDLDDSAGCDFFHGQSYVVRN